MSQLVVRERPNRWSCCTASRRTRAAGTRSVPRSTRRLSYVPARPGGYSPGARPARLRVPDATPCRRRRRAARRGRQSTRSTSSVTTGAVGSRGHVAGFHPEGSRASRCGSTPHPSALTWPTAHLPGARQLVHGRFAIRSSPSCSWAAGSTAGFVTVSCHRGLPLGSRALPDTGSRSGGPLNWYRAEGLSCRGRPHAQGSARRGSAADDPAVTGTDGRTSGLPGRRSSSDRPPKDQPVCDGPVPLSSTGRATGCPSSTLLRSQSRARHRPSGVLEPGPAPCRWRRAAGVRDPSEKGPGVQHEVPDATCSAGQHPQRQRLNARTNTTARRRDGVDPSSGPARSGARNLPPRTSGGHRKTQRSGNCPATGSDRSFSPRVASAARTSYQRSPTRRCWIHASGSTTDRCPGSGRRSPAAVHLTLFNRHALGGPAGVPAVWNPHQPMPRVRQHPPHRARGMFVPPS